jgi:integrase
MVEPIWNLIPATAQQLLNKLSRVLAFSTAKRWRSGANPADWKVLKYLLSKPRKLTRGNRAALPYQDVPRFVANLRAQPNLTARALEFLILSACRANEVLQLRWDEIDGDAFTVPPSRMKGGKPHTVPLTSRMVVILEEMAAYRSNAYVFPGMKLGRALSLESLRRHLKDIQPAVNLFTKVAREMR